MEATEAKTKPAESEAETLKAKTEVSESKVEPPEASKATAESKKLLPQMPYRKEAVEYSRKAGREHGDVLHLSPAWTRWSYCLIVSLLLSGLLYCLFGRVYEYATGPAVIRVEGRSDLTIHMPGVVVSVEVTPGQRVEAGQTLVTFAAEEEEISLERLEREIELLLIRFMRDPSDTVARQALTTVSAERELAHARVEARTLRAPRAGLVGDVRIQPGQFLAAGTPVLSLVANDAPVTLFALLPGHYRPYLRTGMSLRVELEGFRYDYHELTIESVGDQIIGPGEVQRFLGPNLADAVSVNGAVILVKARFSSPTFVNDGRMLSYFDGMPSRAEARVRSERIIFMLLPALKGLAHNE
jgi:biotin carboxyl carrier protein